MLFLAGAVVSPEERSHGKAREGNDRRSRGKTEHAISRWRLWWRLVWGETSRTAPSGYRGPPLALSISPSSETKDAQHFQAILCVHVSCAERVVQCDLFTVYNFFSTKKKNSFFFLLYTLFNSWAKQQYFHGDIYLDWWKMYMRCFSYLSLLSNCFVTNIWL